MRRTSLSLFGAAVGTVFCALGSAGCPYDRIKQPDFRASKPAVVVLDGRRNSGCVTTDKAVGGSIVEFRNLLDAGSCLSRATIFSESHGVSHETGLRWTDKEEEKEIKPVRLVEQPVQIWLFYDPCVAGAFTCSTEDADAVTKWGDTELAIAESILKREFAGISLKSLGVTNLTKVDAQTLQNNPELVPSVQATWVPAGCGDAPPANDADRSTPTEETLDVLRKVVGDLPTNQLNVFYVQDPGAAGVWCANNDPDGNGVNTILIASHHYPLDLAHEIGHALLNLGTHADASSGFRESQSDANLMGAGAWGTSLTIGQLFRANIDAGGAINRQGHRTGGTTNCDNAGAHCPPLNFDHRPR